MPSTSLQRANKILRDIITLLGTNENFTEEQRASIVDECEEYV